MCVCEGMVCGWEGAGVGGGGSGTNWDQTVGGYFGRFHVCTSPQALHLITVILIMVTLNYLVGLSTLKTHYQSFI